MKHRVAYNTSNGLRILKCSLEDTAKYLGQPDYCVDPDLSNFRGELMHHYKVVGGSIVEASDAEIDAFLTADREVTSKLVVEYTPQPEPQLPAVSPPPALPWYKRLLNWLCFWRKR